MLDGRQHMSVTRQIDVRIVIGKIVAQAPSFAVGYDTVLTCMRPFWSLMGTTSMFPPGSHRGLPNS